MILTLTSIAASIAQANLNPRNEMNYIDKLTGLISIGFIPAFWLMAMADARGGTWGYVAAFYCGVISVPVAIWYYFLFTE